jgi:hypothetical protein
MDKIHVCDNFLKKEELDEITNIIKSNKWSWGHASSHKSLIETPFWNMDLIDNQYFNKYLKEVIEKHFNKRFEINRLYANGQTFGQDGTFHIDDESDNCYTFVLYVTNIKDDYIETSGGYIYFKFPEQKYKICYEPIYNRGILFPSNYLHKACSYTRYVMDLRICVAWKLREII